MSSHTESTEQAKEAFERALKRTEAAMAYAKRPLAPMVGQTPKDVVWTKNKAKLYRYHAKGERKHATPILFVYALINRPYILDLAPSNSMVEFLVGEGYDVFLLDWGIPGEEDAGLRFDDYVLDYIPRAVKQVLKHSGAKDFSLIGYCMGGTMATMYAALHPEAPLRNLVLMATPIDFSEAGLFSNWLDPKHYDVDRVVDTYKLVPADFIEFGSKLLKPIQNYMSPYVTLMDRLDDEQFVQGWLVMNHWINDGIPFAGEAFRQWIKELYQQNKLVKGEMRLGGRTVDLSNIRCSLLSVVAELDHIVQVCQSTPLLSRVSSDDAEQLAIKAGHVGLVAGRSAKQKFFPKLDAWLAARSN
ncbi:Poly-beta-hydroxybutyrate polymerase [compost metagenome]